MNLVVPDMMIRGMSLELICEGFSAVGIIHVDLQQWHLHFQNKNQELGIPVPCAPWLAVCSKFELSFLSYH